MAYPLKLLAQPAAWRVFMARKNDAAFEPFAQRVRARDNHTCQFCGFQAQAHQEIVNLDQNYYNNKMANLAVACCFCAQCFFLDAIGVTDYGGGMLIYLPELDQASLNMFCHVLFSAMANDTGYKGSAQSIYRTLKLRTQAVEDQFGEGSAEPAVLGRLLVELVLPAEKTDVVLADIRLLPLRNRFRTQIDYWAKSTLQELSAEGS